MSLPRMTTRRWMVAVAVMAIALGATVHVLSLMQDEGEFAASILLLEGIGAFAILNVAFGVGCMVRLAHKDDAYASELRRRDVVARRPWLPVEPDPPPPE